MNNNLCATDLRSSQRPLLIRVHNVAHNLPVMRQVVVAKLVQLHACPEDVREREGFFVVRITT